MEIFRSSVLVITFCLICILAAKHKKWLEILPSVFWFFFMSLPFTFLSFFIENKNLNSQFIGIFLFSLIFFVSDLSAIRNERNAKNKPHISFVIERHLKRNFVIGVITIILVVIPIMHYEFSKILPLTDLIFGGKGGLDLTNARQQFTKGAHLPIFAQLLTAWYIPAISSIGVYILYRLKARKLFLFLLIFTLSYSAASLEKIPAVFLILCLVLGFSFLNSQSIRNQLKLFIPIFATLLILNLLGFSYTFQAKKETDSKYMAEFNSKKLEGVVTPSDTYRFDSRFDSLIEGPALGLTYRAILTPVDVSFRWYQYYNEVESQKRDLVDSLLFAENPKASNKIGIWAFTNRFPSKYTQYNNSYSSIDADSYSFGGYLGILTVGIIVFFVRFLFKYFSNYSELGKFIYGLCLSYLSVMPFQSGILSILISKGLLFLLLISIFASKIWIKNSFERGVGRGHS
jgi:oligosaccharide repeat unit polymerase